MKISRDKSTIESTGLFEDAQSMLKAAKSKFASKDYSQCLEAIPIAEKSFNLVLKATAKANTECEHYQMRRNEKVRKAWKRVPGACLGWPLLFAIIGAIGGCTVGLFSGSSSQSAHVGSLLGAIGGLTFGIYNIQRELQ